MRVSREQAAENHEQIVEAASRLFRQQGFDGVSVDAIMQQAGLTHGGFYGHFKSKEDLAAQAVARALEQAAERQSRYTDIADLVSNYLSPRHCADRANGCAIAALGADIARRFRLFSTGRRSTPRPAPIAVYPNPRAEARGGWRACHYGQAHTCGAHGGGRVSGPRPV